MNRQRMGRVPYARSEKKFPASENRIWRPKLITMGSIKSKPEAFVYVGLKSHRRVKVGMSSNPLQRCRSLGIELLFTVPVVPTAVKMVETYALQNLGAIVGDPEWVMCAPEEAIDAVCVAWMTASRVAHVNPLITPEEARQARIGLVA